MAAACWVLVSFSCVSSNQPRACRVLAARAGARAVVNSCWAWNRSGLCGTPSPCRACATNPLAQSPTTCWTVHGGQSRQALGQGSIPGLLVAAISVFLDQQEAAVSVQGHQAAGRMVSFIFRYGDGARGHVAGQLLALLLGEGHDGLLKLDLAALAGPQRRGHHAIQMRQTQEGRQQTHTAGPLEAKDQMSGRAELVDEGQPGGGFEEGRADGVVGDGVLAFGPVLECGVGQILLVGELPTGDAGIALLLAKVVEKGGDRSASVAWGSGMGVRGGRLVKHSSAPWW